MSCVKSNNQFSEWFPSDIGVKQGCVLSPLLFSLFLADLPSHLKQCNSSPVLLFDTLISCLLYADNLILMSTSPEGLQASLDGLANYCNTWGLEINVKKSKCMIFNRSGKSLSEYYKFSLNSNPIEVVNNYKYLGLKLVPSGKFLQTTEDLAVRAKRALFALRQKLPFSLKQSPQLSLALKSSLRV